MSGTKRVLSRMRSVEQVSRRFRAGFSSRNTQFSLHPGLNRQGSILNTEFSTAGVRHSDAEPTMQGWPGKRGRLMRINSDGYTYPRHPDLRREPSIMYGFPGTRATSAYKGDGFNFPRHPSIEYLKEPEAFGLPGQRGTSLGLPDGFTFPRHPSLLREESAFYGYPGKRSVEEGYSDGMTYPLHPAQRDLAKMFGYPGQRMTSLGLSDGFMFPIHPGLRYRSELDLDCPATMLTKNMARQEQLNKIREARHGLMKQKLKIAQKELELEQEELKVKTAMKVHKRRKPQPRVGFAVPQNKTVARKLAEPRPYRMFPAAEPRRSYLAEPSRGDESCYTG